MTRRREKQIRADNNFNPEIKREPKILEPKTANQAHFMDAIDNNDVVICDSISGVGKTHISVGMGCQYLLDGRVEKLILMRPPVQCGPDIGHLPGTEKTKVAPYMSPIYDALDHFLTPLYRKELESQNKIQTVVIGYLRGSNLHNCFIIVDEMQNATSSQLKMIGTRIGRHSKLIFSGDMTQTDLGERNTRMIYENFIDPLKGKPGFAFVKLTEIDIIRSRAAKIIATHCK